MQVIRDNNMPVSMNKNLHKLALQAWDEKSSLSAEPEVWMAEYISRLGELMVQECVTLLHTDLTCIDEHGPIAGQILQKGADLITKHFENKDEKIS